MVNDAKELGLTIKKARLLTRAELEKHEEILPDVNAGVCWWLADIDPNDDSYIAYAEGNYTEEDMYCENSDVNMYVRAALELEGTRKAGLKPGDEFIHCGYVFTVLDDTLAISNNFVGCAKYYDEELTAYMYSEDEITCTLDALFGNLFE
ncbi:MAG: hypothetical protein J1E00_00385 [Oscillospiraceae bacterium]|nr:hypothetical protein [Oscillospiraceae bacterium]